MTEEIETAPENAASQRVLEKNGFRFAGKFGEEGPRFRWDNPRSRSRGLSDEGGKS